MANAVIITGDIVNYTFLGSSSEKKMLLRLAHILKDLKYEFYRGDSFQVYSKDPLAALNLVLQLRAAARSFSSIHDIRASIGIGPVESPVKSLRTATGEAFILSGRAFDQLQEKQHLQIQSVNEKANIPFRIIALYTDHIFEKLSPKQAEVVLGLLKEQTQEMVAKKLKKSQSTINKHAQAAGWVEIEKLLNEYREVITQFDLL